MARTKKNKNNTKHRKSDVSTEESDDLNQPNVK